MSTTEIKPLLGAYRLSNPDLLQELPGEIRDIDRKRVLIRESLSNLRNLARDEGKDTNNWLELTRNVDAINIPSARLKELIRLAGASSAKLDVSYRYYKHGQHGFQISFDRQPQKDRISRAHIYLNEDLRFEVELQDFNGLHIRPYTPDYGATKEDIEHTERAGLIAGILTSERYRNFQLGLLEDLISVFS